MRRYFPAGLFTLAVLITSVTFYVPAIPYRAQETTSSLGAIRGRVLDSKGKPIIKARVGASRLVSGLLPSAFTDDQGEFFIGDLKPGIYMLTVSKEDDGYPNTISSFHYSPKIPPQASVYAGRVTSNIVIQLGPKAAKLIAHLFDAMTNQPVEEAEISLRRVDNPNYSYLASPTQSQRRGTFQVLVPSVPITLKVSAPGYENWYYGKDGSKEKTGAIRLEPGTTMELTIFLKHRINN